MPTIRLTPFIKIVITLFTTVVIMLMIGRDHFILGTVLIIFRWVLFVFGLILFYVTTKRITSIYFKIVILVSVVIIVSEYGWNKLLEKNLRKAKGSVEISLMTYNVFFKNTRPDSSISRINKIDPDILVIQELTPNWKTQLENSMRRKYPYKSLTPMRGTHGIGIYSKFTILDSKLLNNSNGRPYAQVVTLEIHDKAVQLINVHLASPAVAVEHPENFISLFNSTYNLRKEQLDSINRVAHQAEPDFDVQLIMGDFNTTRHEPIYRDFTHGWVDLFTVAGDGWGFNFPNSKKLSPVITLDYIFARGFVRGISLEVIPGGSSDHLALAGKVRL